MQASIVNTYSSNVSPSNSYSAKSVIVFDIPGSSTLYLSVDWFVSMQVWITNADDTDLAKDQVAAPVSNFAGACFSDIEVRIIRIESIRSVLELEK